MQGDIIISCPPMPTWRVSATERKTAEIIAGVSCRFPMVQDRIYSNIVFPECRIRKKLALLWQVDQVTALGTLAGSKISLTLKPEWTFGPLALPCKAQGVVGPFAIQMRFPFAWASWTGPYEWTVEAVTAYGTVSP